MFFISWGSRVYRRIFGEPSVHDCGICREQRTFRNMVIYKIYHVWWLFRWVADKDFVRVCTVCNNGVRIDEHDIVPKGTKSPIPFMDRMGWAAGLGGVAALVAMVSVAGAAQNHREDAWLNQPAVNDIYEVDLARMTTNPQASVMYSTLEVVRVSGDTVDARLPKTYFNQMSGVTSAVSDGRAKSPDFYGDKVLSFQLAALQKMREDGTIISVDR
jgi:hypothetical protein